MTFEQQLLRELHHLNKNLEGIRKSLDKLILKSEKPEEFTFTTYSWDGGTDEQHQESERSDS